MLLQSLFICSLLTYGVIFAATVDAVNENRDKRSLDFGVFLKNLLQKSADLSSNSSPKRGPPMRPNTARPSTTTTTSTTTIAPPMLPPPLLQKSFYKVIPGVGRVGIGFGIGGNLRNPPFFYSYDPQGGYIDFDYNDYTVASPPPATPSTTTTTSTTTSTTTTTTTEAPTMTTQRSTTQLVPTRRKIRPVQKTQRRPVPQINAQGRRVIYQYVPAPYFNAQTPAQLNYDYFDQYNGPQGGQPPSYDYPTSYNTRPVPKVPLVRPKPTSLPTTSARPIIVSQNAAFNSRAQLSDNLIYQFAPNDDIYSRDGEPNANVEGVAGNSDGETFDDAADTNDEVSDGSVDYVENENPFDVVAAVTASPNSATEAENNENIDDVAAAAPNVQPSDASIDYDEKNSPPDTSAPFNFQINTQNSDFNYNDQKNEVPYSITSSVPNQGLFVYSNRGPKGDRPFRNPLPIERSSQSSVASMRFRSPFASFHTSTVNNGQQHQPYQTQLQYYK